MDRKQFNVLYKTAVGLFFGDEIEYEVSIRTPKDKFFTAYAYIRNNKELLGFVNINVNETYENGRKKLSSFQDRINKERGNLRINNS